ncbi:hypothetical protein [Phaeacidiphilus oryzae]|uniref:hypothetical protein n=1 Tax=Phaeacidiphilus oryzae TaxID=348818 RepID=UPI00056BF408|nr:hypothetical protein [Phaeacidiphilus oryzae]
MSLRRLSVLLEFLPPESATLTAIRRALPAGEREKRATADPEAGRWSQQEMLLASVIDALRRIEYYTLRINGAKRLEKPTPLPRPGVADPKRRKPIPQHAYDALWELMHGTPGAPPG